MPAINFQNNFGTNLTSGTTAGDTTSPLNSIPSVDAPFILAFDALNANAHYEEVLITSKTATNVNHAATTYNHTTAEEVRLVQPASHLNAMQNVPQGFLLNGKIVPTVASNNLTVAIKGLDGNNPSPTNPVYCRIGDTVRSITAALSVTKNAGTNWFNAGGSELATKEIDYFVYLGYNATDGVVIGFARIPYANSYDDFSATTTDEKYCAISTISNAAATDYYEVIGRFAATLSAGAGYTWTVPTYTAKNMIQRPIYETRLLSYVPVFSAAASTVPVFSSTSGVYKIKNRTQNVYVSVNGDGGTDGSGTGDLICTIPMLFSTSIPGTPQPLGPCAIFGAVITDVYGFVCNHTTGVTIRKGTTMPSIPNDYPNGARYIAFQAIGEL
jgi:hypothetical protein